MPRAKRAQIVSLTKTKKKGYEAKTQLIEQIQGAVESYDYIWIFSVDNMRNTFLKELRGTLKTSRFFFGTNKVMAKALGTSESDSLRENLYQVGEKLVGDVGLLFTNSGVTEIQTLFNDFAREDYPRAGNIAAYTVDVEAGEVVRGFAAESFPNNMEPQLRELGMPTRLKSGKIVTEDGFRICSEGDKLTPQQAQLLKLFWVRMAVFKVDLIGYWHKDAYVDVEGNGMEDDE